MKKRIICWGDSITVGMGMDNKTNYPAVLQKLLGEKYEVINAGGGGETAKTIAARQGAYPIKTAKDFVFQKGQDSLDIRVNQYYHAFELPDKTLINISLHPNPFSPYSFESDSVFIDNNEYFMVKNGKDFLLKRPNSAQCLTIKKGAKVEFLSSKEQSKGSFCEIFYIGTNGRVSGVPTKADIDFLIEQNKKMIARHGNDCYLVVIPYWNKYYAKTFIETFGEKAIDFRAELLKNGFDYFGISPGTQDTQKMCDGEIPPSFRLNNNPNEIHLNQLGYSFLANLLYNQGKKLNYWD
ncbi:MAG: hypothetical protein E7537_04385 [Ruminococcaceae bacterium]|nr:hypothetical protein [Oscillospiraceae bacterium]